MTCNPLQTDTVVTCDVEQRLKLGGYRLCTRNFEVVFLFLALIINFYYRQQPKDCHNTSKWLIQCSTRYSPR